MATDRFSTDDARAKWEAAVAGIATAREAMTAFGETSEPIYIAYEAGRPSLDMIDWTEFPFVDRRAHAHNADPEEHERLVRDQRGKTWWGDLDKRLARIDTLRQYLQAVRENDDRHRIDDLSARDDALFMAVAAAEQAALNTPAPDSDALLWKLEFLLADDGSGSPFLWGMDQIAQTVADMRRLLSAEA